jgi:molecular chaperone GrpE (heat shock protein)
MRYTNTLDVYSKLREGFEEKEAKVIAVAIESALEEADKILLEEVATKKDLQVEIAHLRAEVKEDITNLRAEVKEDMANMESRFKQEIANLKTLIANFKADIIKWMFIFWLGQVTIISGIVVSVVKFVK